MEAKTGAGKMFGLFLLAGLALVLFSGCNDHDCGCCDRGGYDGPTELRSAEPPMVHPNTAPPSTPPKVGVDGGDRKSLYERLGGEAAIKAVVRDFVDRAAADPKVNFTRKGTPREWTPSPDNMGKLIVHLTQFVSMVTGGPQKYEGRSNKDDHKGMGITEDEFNAAAADLSATLDKHNVPAKEKAELMGIVGSTKGDIVEKK